MEFEENNREKLNGLEKTAILLLALGEEFTTSFFKRIDEKTIKKIGRHMSEISYVPSDVLNSIMDEFVNHYENEKDLCISGKSFLKQVVDRSLDESKASEIFRSIEKANSNALFQEFADLPPKTVISIFKDEHPQTIALILSTLHHDKAAEILSLFPDDLKADIAYRILQIGDVQDDIIKDLDEIIKKEISGLGSASKRKFDGIDSLADILNDVDNKTEELIINHIEEKDEVLAERLRQKMFIFEDLLKVDDKGFREILKNINNDILIKALKTASEEMQEKIFKNLSERAAEMLKEDLEVLGPVRLKEVEENQQQIINIAKKLSDEGKIVLSGRGKDDVFV